MPGAILLALEERAHRWSLIPTPEGSAAEETIINAVQWLRLAVEKKLSRWASSRVGTVGRQHLAS